MKIWPVVATTLLLSFPVHPFPFVGSGGSGGTAPTAAPSAVPQMDLDAWLYSLQKAADAVRAAHRKKDETAREAAIADVAKWAQQISDPPVVPDATRLKALEIVGLLAREMNAAKVSLKKPNWVMLDIRARDLIGKSKGQEEARLLNLLGDLKVAQELGTLAFEHYEKASQIAEADAPTVRYATERAIENIWSSAKRRARPLYDRMLTFALSPAEKAEWELRRHLFILDLEFKGADHEQSLAWVKSRIDNPETEIQTRQRLALVYQEELYGEEKGAFIDQMIEKMAPHPALQAQWIFKRGESFARNSDWKQAVASYQEAARVAPRGSAVGVEALLAATMMRLERIGGTDERANLQTLAQSPHLSEIDKFDVLVRLSLAQTNSKDYVAALGAGTKARQIAGADVWKATRADVALIEAYVAQGNLEKAHSIWQALPHDRVSVFQWDASKSKSRQRVAEGATLLINESKKAKKWLLAEGVLEKARVLNLIPYADARLQAADIAVAQNQWDKALAILRLLRSQVTRPDEQATLDGWIANVEAQKAQSGQ